MGFITSIVVGLIAGMLASWLLKTEHKWYIDILIGIAGSLLANFITWLILRTELVTGFNLTSILVSTAGAVLVLLIYGWWISRRNTAR